MFNKAIAAQGSLNRPCVGPSARGNAQNVLGLSAQAGAQERRARKLTPLPSPARMFSSYI
ncbi:hypothetical protein ACFWJM_07335 [Streptomyces sp. NPDC127077]|uniref:hypothetical protein n=1 Tax=Streptomyces sp. NPDC127077 TaxID=3347131 RepID=UPI0036612EB4